MTVFFVGRGQAKASAVSVGGPIHRKLRDEWGTRILSAVIKFETKMWLGADLWQWSSLKRRRGLVRVRRGLLFVCFVLVAVGG